MPRKVLFELYAYKFIPEYYIEKGFGKINREFDVPSISKANYTIQVTGLVKKLKGKLSLTKNALKYLDKSQRQLLFELFLQTFTQKLYWGCIDYYPEYWIIQKGWGFTLYLLKKFGNGEQQSTLLFSEKFVTAFLKELNQYSILQYGSPLREFTNCYEYRTFEDFLNYFGFVEILERRDKENGFMVIKVTGLHKEVVEFDD